MRIAFYVTGIIFGLLAMLCLAVAINGAGGNASFGYAVGTTLMAGGAVFLYAAKTDYNGGLFFLFGVAILSASVSLIWGTYCHNNYKFDDNELIGFVVISLFVLILTSLLLSLGHKCHKNLQAQSTSPLAGPGTLTTDPARPPSLNASDMAEPALLALYPPMRTWRMFLLLIFSGTLYSVFLTYRAAKDLHVLGEKQIRPALYAVAMLIPFYGIIVFLRVTKSIARLGRVKALHFRIKPSSLFWLLILAGLSSAFMPTFLYPLTVFVAAIPWLIVNRQISRLRLAYATEWRQPANRYNWRQISVLVLGVPLMGLIMYGSEGEYRYFAADRLDIGQTVSGEPATYRLAIPDRQWRQVPVGTLYPDTNLELVNKPLSEWVVVRIQPNRQQTLDGLVDQRRDIVAANWKNYRVTETRTLNSGAELTPISLAYYTQNGGIPLGNQPLYVATVVTPEHAVEVIGQGSKNAESSALELVKSFQLTAKGKP